MKSGDGYEHVNPVDEFEGPNGIMLRNSDGYEDVNSVDEFDGPNGIMLRNTEYCKFSYDSESSIVEVDFLKKVEDGLEDNMLIMHLMESDNIVLIMNNLITDGIFTVDKLFEHETRSHPKFKIFTRNGWDGTKVKEESKMASLRVSEYLQYLKKYEEVAKDASEGREVDSASNVIFLLPIVWFSKSNSFIMNPPLEYKGYNERGGCCHRCEKYSHSESSFIILYQ